MCRWCAPSIKRSPRWDGAKCAPSSRGEWRLLLWCCSEEAWEPPTLGYALVSYDLDQSCCSRSLGGMSGTGRSLLGGRTADRPVGCDARRRGCVGYALDQSCCSRSLGSLSGTGRSLLGARIADRPVGCDACRRGCVGYALDLSCCSRSLGSLSGTGCSLLGARTADRPVGCDRRSGVTLAAAAASATLSI